MFAQWSADLAMNYRHGFHAGNFADVIKHIVLVRILVHLQDKPAAFRVIDSHAGAGRYDLTSDEAQRGRRMAHRHRPGDAGAVFASRRCRCSRPISISSGPSTAARAHGLSGIAVDRAGAAATAGPPDRMRASNRPQRKRLIDALRGDDAQGPVVDSMAGSRCRPSCRRKNGAAWSLIDPPYRGKG